MDDAAAWGPPDEGQPTPRTRREARASQDPQTDPSLPQIDRSLPGTDRSLPRTHLRLPGTGARLSRRGALATAAGALTGGGGLAALAYRRIAATTPDGNASQPAPSGSRPSTAAPSTAATTPSGLLALPADLDAEHLIRRVTYGATVALRTQVERSGPTAWLTAQLSPAHLPDPGGDDVVRRFPRLTWTVRQAVHGLPYDDRWALMTDLSAAHIGRATWSTRQVFEVMVDFWSNHLNITNPSDGVWHTRHRFDADVIRRHALGRFEDMLVASTFHPAMLVYLNANDSTGAQPNENYARELLELHTVGVDGGYTERDIKQAAKLITGWTVDEEGRVGYSGQRHYTGQVRLLGWSHANATRSGAKTAVVSLLGHLARHPATARFLATKLATRFVADDPPPALVQRLAAVYLQQRTAITPVLATLFSSPEFAASQGQKLRRPFETLVATLRVLGVRPGSDRQGLQDVYWMLDGMGHRPLAWPMPNGYPDVARKWQSPGTALNQLNAVHGVVQGWWPTKLKLATIPELYPSTPRTRADALHVAAHRLFGRRATAREGESFDRLLGSSPDLPRRFGRGSWEQKETLALATTLLLHSPQHLTR